MQLSDCERVAQIHVSGWQKTYAGIMPQSFLDSLTVEGRANGWRGGMEKDKTLVRLVSEVDGVVTGFAVGLHNRTQELVPEALGELWAIYVDPKCWGQGAGAALLQEFRKRLNTSVCIWVASENKIGHQFYQKTGGKLLAAIKDEEVAGVKIPHQVYLYE